jgi:RNA polymerase sigma-70 factor, ECF subfamily
VLADEDFARLIDPYRRELLAHCYRMLGSVHDAEDLLQETYLRAWRGYDGFEQRSSLRTWLYRIATRACLTALQDRDRRVLPAGLGGASDDPSVALAHRRTDIAWLEPLPDARVGGDAADPAAIVSRRESTRLAFIAALQNLSARQRAALILRDVLDWRAAEVAELLGMSTAAVNSALQRARHHMAVWAPSEDDVMAPPGVDEQVLKRFIAAFETADFDTLTGLLRDDVVLEMPPIPTWFAGKPAVLGFFANRVLSSGTRRLVPLQANGCPAAGAYLLGADGRFHAHSVQVLQTQAGVITHVYAFLDATLFDAFGLPLIHADTEPV